MGQIGLWAMVLIQRIKGNRNAMTPGSSHWKRATYAKKYRRRPKTIQERRRYLGDKIDDLPVKLRNSRSYGMLPSSWTHGQMRSDAENKSWKALTRRRHQYEIKLWNLNK